MSVKSTKTRLLFSFWDGGRCHFTRSMSLAEEAKRRRHQIGFVVSEKYAHAVEASGITTDIFVIPNRPSYIPTPPYPFPLYSHAYRHAQRLRGLGFDNVAWLADITTQEIAAISHFKPNVVVNDYRDTIRTAAQVCRVPVVGITHTTGNVDGHTFGWWVDPPEGTVLPDCRESFSKVREAYDLEPLLDEREMFCGDANIIPSCPELDPLLRYSANSFYVGMISQWQPPEGKFTQINGVDMRRGNVFSYVGEATRPQYGYHSMLTEVVRREPQIGFYIVGDRGKYADQGLEAKMKNGSVVIDLFLPARTVMHDSQVVLCHGGNGTIMLALTMGKPIVCIGPYQSDCTSAFKGVEEAGAGIMLNHSELALERRKAQDLGENVDIFGYWQSHISADKIQAAINSSLEDPRYRANAISLGQKLSSMGGVKRAIDICEDVAR